jgi:hypothetical protein
LESLAVLAILSAVLSPAAAQTATTAKSSTATSGSAKTSTVPRTADGRPDLQGNWDLAILTPLERPRVFADKKVLSEQEAAEWQRQLTTLVCGTPEATLGCHPGLKLPFGQFTKNGPDPGNFGEEYWERGTRLTPDRRTSLIVDPPDGRMPPLTPEARERYTSVPQGAAQPAKPPAGPEDMSLAIRCLVGLGSGPPMHTYAYGNKVRFVQSHDYFVINHESAYGPRVVPLDGRPHLPENLRPWKGDSRGHWEGDTLVVETTNFHPQFTFNGTDKNMHLTERFTRTDAETLLYEYTIDDPTAFGREWTVKYPLFKTDYPSYEFACHEGNRGMSVILGNARADEKAAQEGAKKSPK